jgi:hypothetical protein
VVKQQTVFEMVYGGFAPTFENSSSTTKFKNKLENTKNNMQYFLISPFDTFFLQTARLELLNSFFHLSLNLAANFTVQPCPSGHFKKSMS